MTNRQQTSLVPREREKKMTDSLTLEKKSTIGAISKITTKILNEF